MARRCLKESRIGHTGTLDPLATGVLPLACGRATRLVRFLSASDKDYDAVIRFGLTTDSYDVTGAEVSRSGRVPTREAVEARARVAARRAPADAAGVLGEEGRRAARLRAGAARGAGRRSSRSPVRADEGGPARSSPAATARVALSCSAGFYVRAFAHELGELVGTGACLESLRRTRSGPFDLAGRGHRSRTCSGIQPLRPAVPFRWTGCCWTFPARG